MTQTVAQLIEQAARQVGELQANQTLDADTLNTVIWPIARDWLNSLPGHVTGTGELMHEQTIAAAATLLGNTRLSCSTSATATLPANPRDGWRVVVPYVASGQTLTVAPNGRKLDGATSNVTVTAGATDEWFFRADTANWGDPNVDTADDTVPWPDEFLRGLAAMLAVEIQPVLGLPLKQGTLDVAAAEERRMISRYWRKNPALCRSWRYQPPPPVRTRESGA